MAIEYIKVYHIRISGHHIAAFDNEDVSMFVWCICTSGTLHAPGRHRAAPLKRPLAGWCNRDASRNGWQSAFGDAMMQSRAHYQGPRGNSLLK
jgi:hypothetical protein